VIGQALKKAKHASPHDLKSMANEALFYNLYGKLKKLIKANDNNQKILSLNKSAYKLLEDQMKAFESNLKKKIKYTALPVALEDVHEIEMPALETNYSFQDLENLQLLDEKIEYLNSWFVEQQKMQSSIKNASNHYIRKIVKTNFRLNELKGTYAGILDKAAIASYDTPQSYSDSSFTSSPVPIENEIDTNPPTTHMSWQDGSKSPTIHGTGSELSFVEEEAFSNPQGFRR
jgi:hypothetical protein